MSEPKAMVVRSVEQAAALLDKRRLRILAALAEARALGVPGASAAHLSRELRMPRQLVNYHVRVLEVAGLVGTVEETQRGATTTRVVAAKAERFAIDPAVWREAGPVVEGGWLEREAGRAAKEAAARGAAYGETVEFAFASEDDRAEFMEHAVAELERLAREYQTPGGKVRASVELLAVEDVPVERNKER